MEPLISDPRPDLKADSDCWARLLYNAAVFNRDVAGVLHGLRCLGARIISRNGQWIIAGGQIPETKWTRLKKELAPAGERIMWLLQVSSLGQVLDDQVVDGLPIPWREGAPQPAWVVINSAVLGELVLVLLDQKQRQNAEKKGWAIYTPEEINRLRGQPREALLAYHRQKVAGPKQERMAV